jgi:hypothetical protein
MFESGRRAYDGCTFQESIMPTRLIFLLAGLGLVAVFFLINWNALAAPIPIHLFVFSIAVPALAIILGSIFAAGVFGAIYVGIWRRRLLLDFRRQESELHTHRSLANDAETSRFTQLQESINLQFTQLNQRVSQAVEELRGELRDHEGSLAAALGEMDDRLQRESAASIQIAAAAADDTHRRA